MFERTTAKEALSQANQYPVLTVIGPRQSGKTTLVRQCFPNKVYVNLEAPQTRKQFQLDPISFIEKYQAGAIFGEIQHCPELLSYIQIEVDKTNTAGQFILTGSHQLSLHAALSQSLAGRTVILKLLPLSLEEVIQQKDFSVDEYLFNGFYPRILQHTLSPVRAYDDYIATYIEKDVRQLVNIKDLLTFQRFIKLCASRCGTVLNISNISTEVGISATTIKHWLSILEASFLIKLLPPYFENFGKRLIKSPKLYFTDVGLACHLLDINDLNQISRDPLRGNLFENMVVMDIFKTCYNRGIPSALYYFRDSSQHEVDLLYKQGNDFIAIEIKSGKSYHKAFTKQLDFFEKLVQGRCKQKFLIYAGETFKNKSLSLLNFKKAHTIITERNK